MADERRVVGVTGDGDSQVSEEERYRQKFKLFLEKNHEADIERILLSPNELQSYRVEIQIADLLQHCGFLGGAVYQAPRQVIPCLDQAIFYLQDAMARTKPALHGTIPKERVHARLIVHGSGMELPETHPNIGSLRVEDEEKLITLRGTIIRTGAVLMLEGARQYECKKCKHRFKVHPVVESRMQVEPPLQCPSERGPCAGRNFTFLEGSTLCSDYQEIRIQEPLQSIGVGSLPRSISVILEDDLADSVKAGDDVMVTGVLGCRWKSHQANARADLEHVIHANNIWSRTEKKGTLELTEEVIQQFEEYWDEYKDEPLAGRDGILKMICPQVCGLSPVKLAVALSLIGGVEMSSASGSRVRGECHLLLVGDPGTGKSQFLKYAARLSHCSVLTTGLGTTNAGLTVAAVKQEGQWVLEPGALVLADGGVCCIDEFSGVRVADRAAILEAMEQQSLSIAKAGLVTSLNTRATIIAVTNPKGQYDPDLSLSENTGISAPLLSRFDVVLVLRDLPNPEWDRTVSTHILREHGRGEDIRVEETEGHQTFWTLLRLQSYIRYVKDRFRPDLTPDAEEVLKRYYTTQRQNSSGNAARTTLRMLESLIRLAQAHARLMFRSTVEVVDAVTAVLCIEHSMNECSAMVEDRAGVLHTDFPDQPDAAYLKQEDEVLAKLGLRQGKKPPPQSYESRQRPAPDYSYRPPATAGGASSYSRGRLPRISGRASQGWGERSGSQRRRGLEEEGEREVGMRSGGSNEEGGVGGVRCDRGGWGRDGRDAEGEELGEGGVDIESRSQSFARVGAREGPGTGEREGTRERGERGMGRYDRNGSDQVGAKRFKS